MANLLIIFGTTDGHTAKVARVIGDQLRHAGHHIDIVDAACGDPNPDSYDGVIAAASIHAGRFQRPFAQWATSHSAALNRKPTAFVAVCLAVLQHDPKVEHDLQTMVTTFLRATSWQPLETRTVAGALKYTQYNFLKRWMMKRIVRKAAGDTDTSRDYEYTDWADVRQFADRFANHLVASTPARSA